MYFFYVTEDNCVMITQMYEYVNVIFDLFDLSKRVQMCVRKSQTQNSINELFLLFSFLFFSFHFQINMQASRLYYFCFSIFLHSSFTVLCFYYRKKSFFFCVRFVSAARLVKHLLFGFFCCCWFFFGAIDCISAKLVSC